MTALLVKPGERRVGVPPITPARALPAGTANEVMRRLFPPAAIPSPYAHDPEGWAREVLGVESWSVPRRIRESVRDNRHTAVPACHESAKTHTAATIAAWWIDSHPVGEAFVVTSAPTNDQVRALLWRDIQTMHVNAGLRGRTTGDARWLIDERLVAFGRKTADEANPAKAMQAFQGVHARFPLVIIDEAGGVPEWLFHAADSIAANENGRVLAIGNPDDPTSHFAEICGDPASKWNVVAISAFDTPAFTGEPVSARLLEMLIGPTYVAEMAALGEDSYLYQAKVLGQFPDVGDDALFPPKLLERAAAADLPGTARGGYGVDVARYGPDETVVYRNRGGVIRHVKSATKQDTSVTADMVDAILSMHGHDRVPAMIDAVGIGAGVFDELRKRGLPVIDFNAGEKAFEPDRFVNRRAEVFWTLRERMEAGEIDLDPDDKELRSQLSRLKYRQVSGGRVQIESKDDMRKRGVKSPDRADAAAMALAAPTVPGGRRPLPYRVSLETELERIESSWTADLLERSI